MTDQLLATPLHARAVEANRLNAWENRGGFTLATHYGSVEEEAVAARFGAVIADISWHWRVRIVGARAGEFVSRFFTRDASALGIGAALQALWLNDAGAVRGAGTVVRVGPDAFVLTAVQEDFDWLRDAASLYNVTVEEQTPGVAALIGPASQRILIAAGLNADLPPLTLRKQTWRGIDVMLSRFGFGFEIACLPDDGLIVWDRLRAAGRGQALMPAGQAALDILAFESGLAGRDFAPARDGFSPQPSPQMLGLCGLVDRAHVFNGRRGFLSAGPDTNLSGVLFAGETLVANTSLAHEGRVVGRILNASYSFVMQRAIAFALLDGPGPVAELRAGNLVCRAVGLPFMPIPGPLGATENATLAV
jgi:glycine cleavage system aminomethyltransferase T